MLQNWNYSGKYYAILVSPLLNMSMWFIMSAGKNLCCSKIGNHRSQLLLDSVWLIQLHLFIYRISHWFLNIPQVETRITGSRIDMELPHQQRRTANANGEEKVWPSPLTFWPPVSAHRVFALGCRFTKFGVDSSSHFPFRVLTDGQRYRQNWTLPRQQLYIQH